MKGKISVIIPVFNEQEVIGEVVRRLTEIIDKTEYEKELLFVNDGSSDNTVELIMKLCRNDDSIILVDLSRNFGKEIAVTAGLDFATGDAVVIIDADLQDPPELIPNFIELWEKGFDNVYGRRVARDGETWLKKTTASIFYRVISRLSDTEIPQNTGDFRLLSRRAVDSLKLLREKHRFMKGLFSWVGFPQIAVDYRRAPRFAGTTKWNYWKLWNFAIEGITSFTTTPLKLATYFGSLVAAVSFLYVLFIVSKTLILGVDVPGYASQMVAILFFGGLNLAAIGLLGEYLGRVFNETKNRPLYFTKNLVNVEKQPN